MLLTVADISSNDSRDADQIICLIHSQAARATAWLAPAKSSRSSWSLRRLTNLGTVTVRTPSSYAAVIPSMSTISGNRNFLTNPLLSLCAGSPRPSSSRRSVLITMYRESSTSTLISSFLTPAYGPTQILSFTRHPKRRIDEEKSRCYLASLH